MLGHAGGRIVTRMTRSKELQDRDDVQGKRRNALKSKRSISRSRNPSTTLTSVALKRHDGCFAMRPPGAAGAGGVGVD